MNWQGHRAVAALRTGTAALLLALFPALTLGQTAAPVASTAAPASTATPASGPTQDAKAAPLPSSKDRLRAARLYLEASKLFTQSHFDEAMHRYEQAAKLDPTKRDYALAAQVARSHLVTTLVQTAAKDRLLGDAAAERAALTQALQLDPENAVVAQHLDQLGDDVVRSEPAPLYPQAENALGTAPVLAPAPGRHSFHLRTSEREMVNAVYKAYGLMAMLDDSVRATQVRLDLDNATFAQAMQALELVTDTFHVPIDAHRVLVAADSRANRMRFTRLELETIRLEGMNKDQITAIGTLAREVFDAQHATTNVSAGTLTLRAPPATLHAFNATMRGLLDGRNQVMLDIRLIQLAHTGERNTGVQLSQQVTAFNAYAEEQSILNANQALVQQIISSGLAAPGDTLAILGILLASGQVSSSLFSNGFALFGGGLTLSGLSPGPTSMQLNLNSSDSREIDRIQLHLSDGEEGTLREGSRYPITISSYSNLSPSLPNIPGLTGAGNSSALAALASSLGAVMPTVPQIQYQDLGLTLKATPKVLRNGEVSLSMDMKIDALAGSSINGLPILNNRAYSGVITLKAGAGAVVVSELSRSESRALTGTPGIGDIPGMNNVDAKDTKLDYSTLLIVITPHVVRLTQPAGHTRMMLVDKGMVPE